MPRDGASNYSVPGGTDGVPDTPVASTPYNGFLRDLEQDLNTARPILAGGTSATNARDAMINLSGEVSGQAVANYDSHPFVAGSFYSAPNATGAPTAGAYAGICYAHSVIGDMTLQARSTDDVVGNKLYVRQKQAGVWGAWIEQAGSKVDTDALYVNVTGDIMTGPLIMAGSGEPRNGAIGFGNTGTKYLAYDGTVANNFDLSGPLALPATPPPLANHAVRQDYMAAADEALRLSLQINIDKKLDITALPATATAAEFRSNSAPGKMLTPGAVWGAAGIVSLPASGQIDFGAGFDFVIPGGNIYNPINVKQGQKGCIYIYAGVAYWGTSWKFPNGIKPVIVGSDCISYWAYSSDWIFCTHSPAFS
jgi:hypothetical protein